MSDTAEFVTKIAAGIALICFLIAALKPSRLKKVRMLQLLQETKGPFYWILRILLALAVAHFAAASFILLAAATTAFFYSIALIYGELFRQLQAVQLTAGTVIVHLIFPFQVFLAGIAALLIILAAWEELIGPLPVISNFKLGKELWAKMAMILGIVACLEVLRVLLVGLCLSPQNAADFFAVRQPPRMDILSAALMACGVGIASALFIFLMRRPNSGENGS